MADVDTSIYANLKPAQVNPPDLLGGISQGMQLGQMGMQQAMAIQQMKSQMALRTAYQNNVDPESGQLDQQGVLKDLSKMGMGYMVPQTAQTFAAQNKAQAEAQAQQADAAQKLDQVVYPKMKYLAGMSEDDRSRAYSGIMQDMAQSGVPMHNVPQVNGQYVYDPSSFQQHWAAVANSKSAQDAQAAQQNMAKTDAEIGKTQAETQKTYADIGLIPLQKNAELFGSRAPHTVIQDAYNTEIKPVQASKMALDQMIDSWKNKTPQGDASLVLQNFRIRNPGVPDVNSIEEMKSSQAFTDAWKNKLDLALSGGFDDNTRNNLMRDGISAYRANYNTYQAAAKKARDYAAQQNVPLAGLTNEPGLDSTYAQAMALQKKLGPYVAPADRPGGVLSDIKNFFTGKKSGSSGASTQSKSSVKTGTIDSGYVFMGGDPGDKNNWKPVK